jgi:hypothetical protein
MRTEGGSIGGKHGHVIIRQCRGTPQNDIKSIILTIESKGIRNFDCNHWKTNKRAHDSEKKMGRNLKGERKREIGQRAHPMVVMNDVVNESSENRNKRHDLPTPVWIEHSVKLVEEVKRGWV